MLKQHGLSNQERMRYRGEFQAVYQKGVKAVGPHVVVFALKRERGSARLGVTASRRIGSAVRRNRAKRLLRETMRRHKASFPGSCSLVLVAREGLDRLPYWTVEEELLAAAEQLNRRMEASNPTPGIS